jgi:hypothetical protein
VEEDFTSKLLLPPNKSPTTNKSSILLLFPHTHSLLSHQKEIFPPARSGTAAATRMRKKRWFFAKAKKTHFRSTQNKNKITIAREKTQR